MESYEQLSIGQAGPGTVVLRGAEAGKVVRLRRAHLACTTAGTIQFVDSENDGLTGPIPVGANGGFIEPPTRETDQCLAAPKGRGLQMKTTTAFAGYVVVSVD